MIEGIKTLRQLLDCYAEITEKTKLYNTEKGQGGWGNWVLSQHVTDAHRSLLLAKGWLGKLLGELGDKTPYTKDGQRKTIADVEPVADKMSTKGLNLFRKDGKILVFELGPDTQNKDIKNDVNPVERLDWLREEIQEQINNVRDMNPIKESTKVLQMSREMSICRTNCWTCLAEAKMHLGFELSRIRDEG